MMPLPERREPIPMPKYDPSISAMILGFYSDLIFYKVKDTLYIKDRREAAFK